MNKIHLIQRGLIHELVYLSSSKNSSFFHIVTMSQSIIMLHAGEEKIRYHPYPKRAYTLGEETDT